jgi:uncharacterized membrane protein YheB (UPF0754 family)
MLTEAAVSVLTAFADVASLVSAAFTAATGSVVEDAFSLVPSGLDWRLVLIPPITGIIGYMTNWVAIRLMFRPVKFWGFKIPGMDQISPMLPRKIQQIPGVMEGKIGWQGIVPSRAAKMGSIAYDNSVEKVASQSEFYQQFDPDVVADYVVQAGRDDVHQLVDEILRREHPELWNEAPEAVRNVIHEYVDSRLPDVANRLFQRTGENIDDLMAIKMMVIEYLKASPELLNRMFLEVGDKELKFLVNSGFIFGTLLGCFSIPLFVFVDRWWVLPVSGAAVGYLTNFIAIKAIFSPVHERKIGPFRLQGLFIKRQEESVEKYAEIVAREILTVKNIAHHLLYGPKSDRTRKMIRDSLEPEVDRSVGAAQPLVRATTGDREYESIRESLATEPIEHGYEALKNPEFNLERSKRMKELIVKEMKDLPPEEYVKMLRPAFEEDEWLLIAVGAVLGFVAGWIQLVVVTTV